MAQGKIKRIANEYQKFGADDEYLFLKVQEEGEGEHGEEYWLVTVEESDKFSERAENNTEDFMDFGRGIFGWVDNHFRHRAAKFHYIAVELEDEDGEDIQWLLTKKDLERIRYRVEENQEDIEENKEGWFADLFD